MRNVDGGYNFNSVPFGYFLFLARIPHRHFSTFCLISSPDFVVFFVWLFWTWTEPQIADCVEADVIRVYVLSVVGLVSSSGCGWHEHFSSLLTFGWLWGYIACEPWLSLLRWWSVSEPIDIPEWNMPRMHSKQEASDMQRNPPPLPLPPDVSHLSC